MEQENYIYQKFKSTWRKNIKEEINEDKYFSHYKLI